MAFFKFRLPGQNNAEAQGSFSNPQAESVDAMRRRARHRLMGASVLVLVGVIGFPLVFDTQPRPVSSDIRIDIPDRNRVTERAAPAPTPAPLQTASALDPKEELLDKKNTPTKEAASTVVPAQPEPAPAAAAANSAPTADKDKADAPRFVVQVGAYSDEAKVREVRGKLEKAGLKTYTQVAETKDGKRVRVRLGPFASRDEADKAVAKIKHLNLQAQILNL